MANRVLLKKSSVGAKVPLFTDLEFGELALNYADGKLYFKKSDGTTVDFFQAGTIGSSFTGISSSILNDISSQFDGVKGAFSLMREQDAFYAVIESKELEVVIGGKRLSPYVTTLTYPWLTPFDTIKGYRVRDGTLVIYNPPDVGETALLTYTSHDTTAPTQIKRYPFSATTIALGE